jgi:hypothetical protein
VNTNFCKDDLINETWLELNVTWSNALESIIHALLETSVEIFKNLPLSFEAFPTISSSPCVSITAVVEDDVLESSFIDHGYDHTSLDTL